DYPGRGTIATSDMAAAYAWRERIFVGVPEAAYTPGELEAYVGWYHLPTGERMHLADGSEMIMIGTLHLAPRPSPLGVPNPLSVNFGDRIELVGYELSTLNPLPGGEVELTLFWRALRPVEHDYIVFAHLIHAATATGQGASDAMPAQGQAPTSTWATEQVVTDRHRFIVNPPAPPGLYELEIGLYLHQPDGSFTRLPIRESGGDSLRDFYYLTRLWIAP
ncbi:MAG: hypothetical protein ACRDIB_01580, partial [Ardenticatenaceae bacterium]